MTSDKPEGDEADERAALRKVYRRHASALALWVIVGLVNVAGGIDGAVDRNWWKAAFFAVVVLCCWPPTMLTKLGRLASDLDAETDRLIEKRGHA